MKYSREIVQHSHPDRTSGSSTLVTVLLAAVLLIATALVIAAARGDLWLDEIWSLGFADNATSPLEIFTRFKHDNNHILNTLYLYFLGPHQSHLYAYRLLAVISGIGSLVILAFLARRQGEVEGLCVALLAGGSYPLILYFSEARGYAPAIFCALLAFALWQKCQARPSPFHLLLLWLSIILGILAHLTFVMILLAMLCATTVSELASSKPLQKRLTPIIAMFAVPCAFILALYFLFIKTMTIGGGDSYNTWEVLCYASDRALGIPEGPLAGSFALFCYIGLIVTGVLIQFRNRNELWVFNLVALLIAPPLMLALTKPQVLYFRYFVICFPFFYLLLGDIIGALILRRAKAYLWTGIGLILLMLIGHSTRITPLLIHGRGAYKAALSFIASRTTGPVISIGSDHDFRNGMLLSFYSRFLPDRKELRYIRQEGLAEQRPDWVITHTQDSTYVPPAVMMVDRIGSFRLMGQYRYSRDSGWNWFVYHSED